MEDHLFPRIAAHLAGLITPLGGIGEPHRSAGRALAEWVSARRRPGETLPVLVVCTGNSRRSVLGAMMGNAAASYLGLPEIRFFSVGTTPSAFNPRTIAALEAIGFEVEPTGEEAPRGPEGAPNPRYVVRWGNDPAQRMTEFSKALGDAALPREGFAALMVCDEADAGCPFVPGASARISMPFEDPKSADGTPDEAARYAERRDEIGRVLLAALGEARHAEDQPNFEIGRAR
jgi:arsenate reductase